MARKRDSVDSGKTRDLLAKKLRLLQEPGSRPRSLALDLLTGGGMPVEETAAGVPATPLPSAARPAARRPASAPAVRARTVYLSDQDLQDLDHIAHRRAGQEHRRISRSRVLREAIAALRSAIDADGAPPSGQR